MLNIPWKALLICFACAFIVPATVALTVIPPTFEQLVDQSDAVIEGEVTGVRTELAEYEGRPLAYTFVTVRVMDEVKGRAESTMELRFLGGTVGDFTLQVAGMPRFEAGDHALFFVAGNGQNFCPLVGVTHGFYPVATRSVDGAAIVLRSNGLPLESINGVEAPLERAGLAGEEVGDQERAMKLQEFKKRIREEVANVRTP